MAMTKTEMMERLTETVSSPEFDKLIREIDEQPADTRLAWTKEHATVEAMKSRGIPIIDGDGFRLCVRMFEDSDKPTTQFDTIDLVGKMPTVKSWTICASLGYIFCGSVGATY